MLISALSDYSQCIPGAATSAPSSAPAASTSKPATTSVGASPSSGAAGPSKATVANISPEWAAAYKKAQAAVAKLSVTDMVNLGTGEFWY